MEICVKMYKKIKRRNKRKRSNPSEVVLKISMRQCRSYPSLVAETLGIERILQRGWVDGSVVKSSDRLFQRTPV